MGCAGSSSSKRSRNGWSAWIVTFSLSFPAQPWSEFNGARKSDRTRKEVDAAPARSAADIANAPSDRESAIAIKAEGIIAMCSGVRGEGGRDSMQRERRVIMFKDAEVFREGEMAEKDPSHGDRLSELL